MRRIVLPLLLILAPALRGQELDILDGLQPSRLLPRRPAPVTRVLATPREVRVRPVDPGTPPARALRRMRDHIDDLQALAVSPDDRLLATGGLDGRVRLWDPETGAIREGWRHPQGVRALEFSPDGKLLAICGETVGGGVELRDVSSVPSRVVASHPGVGGLARRLCFSPDGTRLVVGTSGRAAVLKVGAGLEAELVHKSRTVHVASFSPDGKTLITGDDRGTLVFWSVGDWKQLETVALPQKSGRHGGSLRTLRHTPDGRRLEVQTEKQGAYLELESRRWTTHREWSGWGMASRAGGRVIATAPWGGKVQLWDAERGLELLALEGHRETVTGLRFLSGGRRLASSSDDGSVVLWEIEPSEHLLAIQAARGSAPQLRYDFHDSLPQGRRGARRVKSGALDPKSEYVHDWLSGKAPEYSRDGKLYLISSGGSVEVRDAKTGKSLLVKSRSATDGRVHALSPDGKRLLYVDKEEVVLTAVPGGEELLRRKGPGGWLHQVAWSPDGGRFAASSGDEDLRVWDAAGKVLHDMKALDERPGFHLGYQIRALAFSPDGEVLASAGDDGAVRLWDASSGELLATGRGHEHRVLALVFLDAGRLVSAGSDGTLRTWDRAGSETARVEAHNGPIHALAGRPGTWISGSRDGTLILWDGDFTEPDVVLETNLRSVDYLALSPDGEVLTAASDSSTHARILMRVLRGR